MLSPTTGRPSCSWGSEMSRVPAGGVAMRSVHWIAAAVLVLPALAACSERQEVRKPLQQGADMIITYIVAKRELADRLGEALGANRSSKYRLMALVGPSYPIGAAVDPENTIDIITEKCVPPKSALARLKSSHRRPSGVSRLHALRLS